MVAVCTACTSSAYSGLFRLATREGFNPGRADYEPFAIMSVMPWRVSDGADGVTGATFGLHRASATKLKARRKGLERPGAEAGAGFDRVSGGSDTGRMPHT